ncbi:MAG TPA: Rrf2 family transcriptional regulator [Blastocatellia bacterium]|nr:Rrf2 family transcriptional regulator [Blastocatellia bacterium]
MALIGKGVEYALHCLTYLVQVPGQSLSVSDIAEFQGVSPTYLAKVFGRLKRAGIVRSSRGVRGGFELARPARKITFWDVAVAVEGELSVFQCHDIRNRCILKENGKENGGTGDCSGPNPIKPALEMCTIHRTMVEAERQIEGYLRTKTLEWLTRVLTQTVPPDAVQRGVEWFENAGKRRR